MHPDLDKLFSISAEKRSAMPNSIWFPATVDTHIHCRLKQTGQMKIVVAECVREHEAIVDIPNVQGVTTIESFGTRRSEILSCVSPDRELQVRITPLINDKTDPDMLRVAHDEGYISGVKIFWQGVSNDYGNSISRAAAIKDLIQATTNTHYKNRPLIVTVHAECLTDYAGKTIPIKDREFWCVEHEVQRMVSMNPDGIYVIRHISDYRTLEWITDKRRSGLKIYGELSPQYLILIDDDIFTGEDGHAQLQCNCVFWPRPKDKRSQLKIQQAALADLSWLHIGTDYAMHLEDPTKEKGVKINSRGEAVGGLNFLPRVAKSLLIDFFLSHGKLQVLEHLMSLNPAKLYGITLSDRKYEYVRRNWTVPEYSYGEPGSKVKSACFLRGHTMHWQRQ